MDKKLLCFETNKYFYLFKRFGTAVWNGHDVFYSNSEFQRNSHDFFETSMQQLDEKIPVLTSIYDIHIIHSVKAK